MIQQLSRLYLPSRLSRCFTLAAFSRGFRMFVACFSDKVTLVNACIGCLSVPSCFRLTQVNSGCRLRSCFLATKGCFHRVVTQGLDLQNILRQSYAYLTIMPKLRSTYDDRMLNRKIFCKSGPWLTSSLVNALLYSLCIHKIERSSNSINCSVQHQFNCVQLPTSAVNGHCPHLLLHAVLRRRRCC